jgi:hypothetical protein
MRGPPMEGDIVQTLVQPNITSRIIRTEKSRFGIDTVLMYHPDHGEVIVDARRVRVLVRKSEAWLPPAEDENYEKHFDEGIEKTY